MEHDASSDELLVAYQACLADALRCLLTAEGVDGNDSDGLLASTLRLHLRKQQAFIEYSRTSAQFGAVDVRHDDFVQQANQDAIQRRLLIECFQGTSLHYAPIQRCIQYQLNSTSPTSHSPTGRGL